jgi:hypothetical protein
MPSDRPGVLMRRMTLDLLNQHGEAETRRSGAVKASGQRPTCAVVAR